MAKVNRLSEADHKLVSDAVAEAERGTDGEIVTIVTDLSDKYHDAGLHWAIGIMFLALALFAVFPQKIIAILSWAANGWEHEFSLGEVLPILFVLLAAKFLAVRYILAWMPLRLARHWTGRDWAIGVTCSGGIFWPCRAWAGACAGCTSVCFPPAAGCRGATVKAAGCS